MKLTIQNVMGAAVGERELPDHLLTFQKGAQAVHDMVVAHLAARRAGTASTLRKGEVAGSNKKPWRQKGTGRARAGLRQSPVWRGGGVAFGPHPRDFGQRVNKKAGRLAFRRAFSEKVKADAVKVVEGLEVAEGKTKLVVGILKSLGIDKGALFVMDEVDKKLVMASRNVPGVDVVRAKEVNVYQMLRYPVVVVNPAGMDVLESRLRVTGAGKERSA